MKQYARVVSSGLVLSVLLAMLVAGAAMAEPNFKKDECWAKTNGLEYKNAAGQVLVQFAVVKQYCHDGKRVYDYGTFVDRTWVKPGPRKGEGWTYVPASEKQSNQYVTYEGRPKGGHKTVTQGRFAYRKPGVDQRKVRVPKAYQVAGAPKPNTSVLTPRIIQTGIYDGRCTDKRIRFP